MFFFFFKQKTAYEMRISDWSSDVCSSDLVRIAPAVDALAVDQRHGQPAGTVLGHARIDQGGDVGMVEAGEDRGFAAKAFAARGAERAEGQDLHRCLLARHALLAPGAVDHGHAAAAELGVERPVAEAAAGEVAGARIE